MSEKYVTDKQVLLEVKRQIEDARKKWGFEANLALDEVVKKVKEETGFDLIKDN